MHAIKPRLVTVPGRERDKLKEGHGGRYNDRLAGNEIPVIIEHGEQNFSAYVPALPGRVSTGQTLEETPRNIQEAIELHLAGMREDGVPIPPPSAVAFAESRLGNSDASLQPQRVAA